MTDFSQTDQLSGVGAIEGLSNNSKAQSAGINVSSSK
jgi:hypothetical protein